ncbi:cytochrome P450, partial [Atractiella rhizophila]
DSINSLPYLEACVREILRLHPPVASTARSPVADDYIPLSDGKRLRVRKGQRIQIGIEACNKLKSVWGEDAAEFRPERWLEKQDASKIGVYGGLLTFLEESMTESTLGFRFAVWEMKVLIWNLVSEFEFRPRSPETRSVRHGVVTVRPRYPESLKLSRIDY